LGLSLSATKPSTTSPKLCGGILVAIPTAIPLDPLTNRFGKYEGSTTVPEVNHQSWEQISRYFYQDREASHPAMRARRASDIPHRRGESPFNRTKISLSINKG